MKFQTLIPLRFETSQGVIELKPGDTFEPKDEEAIRWLLIDGRVRPLSDVMAEKYRELTGWLHQFDLTVDELKETLPGLYQDIQDAIESLDNSFVTEDLAAFQDAFNKVRELYTEALFKDGRRVAVKVWSEILHAYLWVVETDKDMHSLSSQGIKEVIYTADEIKRLKGLSNDSLKEVHKAKEVFESSRIEEIKPKNGLA